ncbi:transient receptor potential cation channel subfamily M member 2-like isoform X1 [Liolophura sinensis]|uniref:transient receptor potential cation channel subfamily M member 2-like isoform X1 n=1 Tax=Liolophura sinensis TaxID=3198878 RepID=UPI0031593F58
MAIDSQAVMSHESFEPVINEVWMGDLANCNSRWKVFCFSLLQMRFCLTYKRAKGLREMCRSSAAAPVIKYFRFMLSYLAFLTMYTINLLLGRDEAFPALGWIVATWVVTAFIEELTQVIRFRGVSLMTALIFVPYLLFVVGFILRNPHHVIHYEIGTLILSIALSFFYLNSLRFFLASRPLG